MNESQQAKEHLHNVCAAEKTAHKSSWLEWFKNLIKSVVCYNSNSVGQ